MEYELRPPRVRAEQWSGTVEGARELEDLLKASNRREWSYRIEIGVTLGGTQQQSILHFDTPIRGGVGSDKCAMLPGMWLLLDVQGRLEIMEDEILQRDYIAVRE